MWISLAIGWKPTQNVQAVIISILKRSRFHVIDKVGYKMPVARVVFVIGILGWIEVTRLVRSSFLEIKNLEYVESARVLGAGTPRIMVRHILPNALG
jgi:ABC-type dipeptide/oligopeptide/nickel transport system permease subunit